MSWPKFSDSSEKRITSVFAFFCLWTRFLIRDNDHSCKEGNSYLIWLPVLELDRPVVCSVSEKGITEKYFMHETSFIPSLDKSHSWSFCREQPLSFLDSSSSIFFSGLFSLLKLRFWSVLPFALVPCLRLNVRQSLWRKYRRWAFSWNQLWCGSMIFIYLETWWK